MMKHFFILLTLTLTLFAQTPKSFAALGDVIYNDISTFEKLKGLASMQEFSGAIESYVVAADKAKKMGYSVDAKDGSVKAEDYLAALRKLSVEHDAIVDNSTKRFSEAMHDEDGETVNAMINYGVIDTDDYKKDLVNYYEEFSEDQNLSSLDAFYAKHLASLVKDTNKTLTQKQLEQRDNEENIKRMRAHSEAKKTAFEKSVKDEQSREKAKVLETQKKELGL